LSSTILTPRAAAIADLTHLVVSWPALRDALTTRPAVWPPVMGLHLERDDEQQAEDAAEHAERTAAAPGERPAPVRVAVLDTITEIEREVLALADETASSIQRPTFTVRPAGPDDLVARDIALMALRDGADPRRWRFNLAKERTGATAANWLADRLTATAGPFCELTDDQVRRIASVAAACRHRAEPLIASPTATDGRPVALDQECGCGGTLSLTNEPTDFVIRCGSCGTSWRGATLLDDLNAA
jgi:hypothetical protein